ncbi:MAG: hypothetical protein AAFP03_05095 [Cyanobacteria bacterium J06598_3]
MKPYDDSVSGPLSGNPSADLAGDLAGNLTGNLTEALTLTGARPRLTASPQMSFADLKVRHTAYGLELHFSQRRIQESLMVPVARPLTPADDTLFSEQTALTILAVAATIFFVGGAVAVTGSAGIGLLIAAILPIVFWFIVMPKGPKQYGKAILRVSSVPNGRTLLTLKTLPAPPPLSSSKAHKRLRNKHFALKSTVQCANLPVLLISHSLSKRRLSHLKFVFEAGNKCRGHKRLHITGTRQEIQWLHRHLVQQENMPTAR